MRSQTRPVRISDKDEVGVRRQGNQPTSNSGREPSLERTIRGSRGKRRLPLKSNAISIASTEVTLDDPTERQIRRCFRPRVASHFASHRVQSDARRTYTIYIKLQAGATRARAPYTQFTDRASRRHAAAHIRVRCAARMRPIPKRNMHASLRPRKKESNKRTDAASSSLVCVFAFPGPQKCRNDRGDAITQ